MSETETTPELKYLFVAEHSDGTIVDQTNEDISLTKEHGSAFSDVKIDLVTRFHLASKTDHVLVDLTDGHFEVNGFSFQLHEQTFVPVNPLRLVYFRETRVETDVNNKGEHINRRHFVSRYFLGWQTNDAKGKNVQHTIAVS